MRRLNPFLLLSLVLFFPTCLAQDKPELELPPAEECVLFTSTSDSLYRIPAIAAAGNGTVVAIADYRHDHGYDVGVGKPLDILFRVSNDNGRTWSDASVAVSCEADYADGIYGFGDCSIVADRESNEMMLLCVGDREAKTYGQGGRLEVHRFVSKDGGHTWGGHTDLTSSIYGLGADMGWNALFIASGKIFQSRTVKKGNYYRLYCAVLAKGYGNAVLYSDDFGANWNLLGGPDSACPGGDEAKVEELPDGTVILSSRTQGRFFNLFRFDDTSYTTGSWTGYAKSKSITAHTNSTNGEIMAIKVEDGYYYLQSIPAGPGRSHVSIYYKFLPSQESYEEMTAADFGKGWSRYEITEAESAYSTFCLQQDGVIAFLYEYKGSDVNGYDIVYVPLTLSEICHYSPVSEGE